MRRAATLLAIALVALAWPTLAQQEKFGHCGTIALIFMNPDLQVRDDGLVHVSGTFFIQFQAIGPDAARVAKIGYSFGKPVPDPLVNCDFPGEPLLLAGMKNYRMDAQANDGFFVPVNTTSVPDSEYAASIVAYDEAGNYLSAFHAIAVVENGPNCRTDKVCEDRTAPWPMILPGDGEQVHDVGGITVEFGEPVQDVTVKVNGEQVIPEAWVPPARDDDLQPDNDHDDCGPLGDISLVNLCHRTVWGSGFRLDVEPQDGDVVEVKAIDLQGNEATKIVTVGGATQGGAIELVEPELTLRAEATEVEVEAGQGAEYRVTLTNVGSGAAEARMTVAAPEGVTVTWSSPTATVPSGGEETMVLTAQPNPDVRPGAYTLNVKATYKSGTADQEKVLALTLKVTEFRPVPESPLRRTRANVTDEATGEGDAARNAPGAETALLLAGLALAETARRRRRDR